MLKPTKQNLIIFLIIIFVLFPFVFQKRIPAQFDILDINELIYFIDSLLLAVPIMLYSHFAPLKECYFLGMCVPSASPVMFHLFQLVFILITTAYLYVLACLISWILLRQRLSKNNFKGKAV